MSAALARPEVLSLAAGFTDTRSLPVEAIGRAVHRLTERAGPPEHLQYGSSQGRPVLRRLLADRIASFEPARRNPWLSPERIVVTNGSQQALYLAIQVLCEPGDIVLVDRPSYFVFLEMLRGLGVRPISLPVDFATGALDIEAVETLLDRLEARKLRSRVRAVYLVSYFSNPSGHSMSEEEKIALGRLLAAKGLIVPILEDAAYRELYFDEAHPAAGVVALKAFSDFPRLYCATTTKTFASGLKVGYACCTDEALLARMLAAKGHHDFGTANFNQAVMEEVLAAGDYADHLLILRARYQAKGEALHRALLEGGLEELGWRWQRPLGGLYLWLRAPGRLDTRLDSDFNRTCLENGVMYVPGDLCFGDNPERTSVRLSFGVLDEAELAEAARRFCLAAKAFS